jgi:hypothetical protein
MQRVKQMQIFLDLTRQTLIQVDHQRWLLRLVKIVLASQARARSQVLMLQNSLRLHVRSICTKLPWRNIPFLKSI